MAKQQIIIYYQEIETHYVRKKGLVINEETHPELAGMTTEEMQDYVEQNLDSMSPLSDAYENLQEEAEEEETERDKWILEPGTGCQVEIYKEE
jgi:hypothetical protein